MDELNLLLDQQPSQVYDWIHRIWEGTQQEPEHFNWLGLVLTFTRLEMVTYISYQREALDL